ncbi:DNA repair protein REV1 [Planococcus citri]|uniref:DNA repair protein REV1 n=1 Tax=Planococcus citri TaxID=170843 RepID=UPI0031F9DCFB
MNVKPNTSQIGDGWDDYMSAKKSKLHEQFSNEASNVPQTSDIFSGVSVFVNGYTIPPADELRRILMSHGGDYHHYYENGNTTYMIATVLPAAKINAFKNSKMKIIKPEWITDCLNAKKLLDHKPYLLLTNTENSFFSKRASSSSENSDISISASHSTSSDIKLDTSFGDSNDSSRNIISPVKKNNSPVSKPVQNSPKRKTARDENFIEEFYSNSRLHHLSTMSVKLKTFISDLRSKNSNEFSGKTRLKKWKLAHESELQNHNFVLKDEKCIMHIDMDCFFVSVGIRNRPDLKGLPVAVAHSRRRFSAKDSASNEQGSLDDPTARSDFRYENFDAFDSMSEIASCSYKAREFGIKNSMLVGQALKLCPQLTIIPYDFSAYEEVTYAFYKHIASYTLDVEAVSCDEVFVDCTEVLKYANIDSSSFATILRKEINEITGCTCSVGFGPNRLISRLATKIAKPNGQLCISNREVSNFIKNIPVSYLPGVGGSMNSKLTAMGVKTCEDVQKLPASKLQQEFGKKLGLDVHRRCFGEDDRPLNFNYQRKSLSADVNYGIRFQTKDEAETFLKKLSLEVENRLTDEKLKGSSITLKFMVKSKDAPYESAKFLGHGICDAITKTISLNQPTSDANVICRIAIKIMQDFKISPDHIRGIGIQVSRLEKEKNSNSSVLMDKFIVKKSVPKKEVPSCDEASTVKNENNVECVDNSSKFNSNVPMDNKMKLKPSISPDVTLEFKHTATADSISFGSYITADKTFNDLAPVSEITRAVELWITSENDPQLSDVEMLFSFIKSLASKNGIESLNFIADKLNRFLETNENVKWKMIRFAFMELVDSIYQIT